jgi:hypothetical protein
MRAAALIVARRAATRWAVGLIATGVGVMGFASTGVAPMGVAAVGVAGIGLAWTGPARAQNAPIQSAPLPPLQEQARPGGYASPPQPGAQGYGGPGSARPGAYAPGLAAPGPGGPGTEGPGASGPGAPGPGAPGFVAPGTGAVGSGVLGSGSPGSGPGLGIQGQGQTPPTVPAPAPPTTVERPNLWVPASIAKLQALDKVNAQASELTIKVGQSATFGSLTIAVKSCVIRPPDQPADAAVYVDVTDSHPEQPGFDGWMLEDEPSVSMMQHPIYDLRVTGCS